MPALPPLLPLSFNLPQVLRTLATLAVAGLAAWLCVWLHTPIPWMIGPLLATAVLSVLGAPMVSWVPLRNSGQWVIGTALGLYSRLLSVRWWPACGGALHWGWCGRASWGGRWAGGWPMRTPRS